MLGARAALASVQRSCKEGNLRELMPYLQQGLARDSLRRCTQWIESVNFQGLVPQIEQFYASFDAGCLELGANFPVKKAQETCRMLVSWLTCSEKRTARRTSNSDTVCPVLCHPYLTHALEGRGKQRRVLSRGGLEEADSLLRKPVLLLFLAPLGAGAVRHSHRYH